MFTITESIGKALQQTHTDLPLQDKESEYAFENQEQQAKEHLANFGEQRDESTNNLALQQMLTLLAAQQQLQPIQTKENLAVQQQQSTDIIALYTELQSLLLPTGNIQFSKEKQPTPKMEDVRFFKIDKLTFDEEYPRREAFENVLLTLDNPNYNFVYILSGTPQGVSLCMGVVLNQNASNDLSAGDYGKKLHDALEGNFGGSVLSQLRGNTLETTVAPNTSPYTHAGFIQGIPSIDKQDGNHSYDFQGIDRLINSMDGQSWRMVVVCEPVSRSRILELQEDVYNLYNRLALCAKRSVQQSQNTGTSFSFGKNHSTNRGKNISVSEGYSEGKSNNNPSGKGSNSGKTINTQDGKSEGSANGDNQSATINQGASNSLTVEVANKKAMELMKYIDEELLMRIKTGLTKGFFQTSVYYMAENLAAANRLKSAITTLFQGETSTFSPLNAIDFDAKPNRDALFGYKTQFLKGHVSSEDAMALFGQFSNGVNKGAATLLTADEISLLAGLPQKEVPGISLNESVAFGLNCNKMISDPIQLGPILQRGRKLNGAPFSISRKSLSKHIFIAGVTGSGKTTTCQKLLKESKLPFLVIEPAKTEYRPMLENTEDLVVFTLGNDSIAPFRLNPFEIVPGEIISAHIDMMKATFTSAFPMEASMPQILEESIYRCYSKKGWNIRTNKHNLYGDSVFDKDDAFPILSDLLEEIKTIVEEKNFGAELKANYIGSLVSRISNLTVGAKGGMLNCARSINFDYLIHHNVILEMEELKSPEDKALLMGFILANLSASIKKAHQKNPSFAHITLVEEAHRLLSKVEYGDSGSKKAAVETFADLLAEVRKYGEGLVVVDQIPNKLAPEVLKNTNTKIIHKVLARDDKEAVGDTMMMNDKQKEFLSALQVGHAVVFSEHTDKPIHIAIDASTSTSESRELSERVHKRFETAQSNLGMAYQYYEIEDHVDSYLYLCGSLSKHGSLQADSRQAYQLLTTAISGIARKYVVPSDDVWRKLIARGERISGIAAANQGTALARIDALATCFKNRNILEDSTQFDPYSAKFDSYRKYI